MDANVSDWDLKRIVFESLREDIGRGDVTTQTIVPADAFGRARIEAREQAVIAGSKLAQACFDATAEYAGGSIEWRAKTVDGERVGAADVIAVVEGPMAAILTAERAALNLLGCLSGVATMTAAFVAAIAGTSSKITDTRKTTPGMRVLEKYAVLVGGGTNHRSGLDTGILIKDNHIAAAGGITQAVTMARANAPHSLRIEVEVEDLAGLDEAISSGADVVLLDNMQVSDVRKAVECATGKVILEASGGISLDNVREYAETGVDLISVGALTHSARCIDVALEVENRW